MRTDDIAGVAEVADLLAVTKATVSTWVKRGHLAPVAVLACGPIFDLVQVRSWAARTGRGALVVRGEVTSDDMRSALAYLPTARATAVAELQRAADGVRHLLANAVHTPAPREVVRDVSGQIASNDGAGNREGEWDWYFALAASERSRLRRWMSDRPSALAPDQVASAVGSDDLESTMREWTRATSLVEAVRAVTKGRAPAVEVDAETSFDLSELFGPEPVEYLARELAAERERYGAAPIRNDHTDEQEEVF